MVIILLPEMFLMKGHEKDTDLKVKQQKHVGYFQDA